MVTLFALYMVAIAIGAGASFIFDFFFVSTLKDHKLTGFEVVALKQLNLIQLFTILWILVVEITFISLELMYSTVQLVPGMLIAKVLIALVVLFCVLLIKQVHYPALLRHQRQYHHLSNSFLMHSDGLIGTCAISIISWFFIILITAGEVNAYVADFGFTNTIITYAVTTGLFSLVAIKLKNKFLHIKRSK